MTVRREQARCGVQLVEGSVSHFGRYGRRMSFMTFVAINVLTVPDGNGELLEERFAGRAGSVEHAEGFEHFELLRPIDGTDQYLVYTRWRDRQSFDAWTASRSFAAGHAEASGRPAGQAPAASGSTIWAFEVAQSATPVN